MGIRWGRFPNCWGKHVIRAVLPFSVASLWHGKWLRHDVKLKTRNTESNGVIQRFEENNFPCGGSWKGNEPKRGVDGEKESVQQRYRDKKLRG